VRESKKMIERALSTQKSQNEEPFFKDFFKSMKIGFKSKNFIGYIAFSIGNAVFVALFLPSMLFYVQFVLNMEAGIASFIAIPYVLAGLLPLPLFFWLTNKYGHLKIFKLGILLMPLSLVPLLFASDLTLVLVTAIFIGLFPSLIGVAGGAVKGDFIDEGSITKGKRVDGTYNAIVVFITRVGTIIQYLTIFLIHDVFTDFDPEATSQSLIAIWGLRVQISLVPIVALYLGAFMFIRLWNINIEKSDLQKKKLEELNF
jgi:Na+/melibiose symporter-like transporter